MRKNILLPIAISVISILTLFSSCKKNVIDNPYDVFTKEYTTGVIKFSYSVPFSFNGINTNKDTTVEFTSIGNNQSEKDYYGYSKPSTPWVQLHRLNPKDFQNRTFIFFVGTNLNSLTLPYKFKAGDIQDAQINYVIGLRPFYDTLGNLIYGTNTYAASTYSENFELTVLSRVNNRLQGIYSGTIKNQDGLILNIKNGLFDIGIVER